MSALSDLLGYTSIACWLGAQFPQVLENIRRQSCEGLALPFLANWLLGDISNLIGCILTHQLPFQTWLATYFVCVDLMLVVQYVYYSRGATPSLPSHGHSRASTLVPGSHRISTDRTPSRYRTLSAVAANVAAAAALAAQQDEQADYRRRWHRHSVDLHDGSDRRVLGELSGDEDVDEDALAALGDSFYSEGGHGSGRKRVSWSIERHGRRDGSAGPLPELNMTTTRTPLPLIPTDSLGADMESVGRGRALQRELAPGLEIEPEMTIPPRRNSRASRRGATMVFLGAWALFGVGTFANGKRGLLSTSKNGVGRVLSPRALGIPDPVPAVYSVENVPPIPIANLVAFNPIFEPLSPDQPHHYSLAANIFSERVLGRIFAWLCTTLYLTSRLPQIWKNFVRKSVEGLSMYLFIFAFLGNSFYVASILSSPNVYLPPPASTEFIRESIPYLLGSAGTLMFDITIVTQSFIYRPRHRRHNSLHGRMTEEETGLLTGDSLVNPQRSSGDSTVISRGRTSRIRTAP